MINKTRTNNSEKQPHRSICEKEGARDTQGMAGLNGKSA